MLVEGTHRNHYQGFWEENGTEKALMGCGLDLFKWPSMMSLVIGDSSLTEFESRTLKVKKFCLTVGIKNKKSSA